MEFDKLTYSSETAVGDLFTEAEVKRGQREDFLSKSHIKIGV